MRLRGRLESELVRVRRARHAARTTFSSLRIRNFRLFITGQAISLCGTWLQTVALSWLVLTITGSATQVGLVVAAQFVPVLLLGAWGGAVADRYPKRRLLYATQAGAGVLALTLGILASTGRDPLWSIYALAVALGLINVLDNPARQAFVAEMVGADHVRNAVALNSTMVNAARVIGPAIAASLLATLGVGVCFLANGFSYVAVLVALRMMRPAELQPARPAPEGGVREGLQYVRRTPQLRSPLVMMLIVGTLTFEMPVVLPLFARSTLHGGGTTYAVLTLASGAGAVIGGLWTAAAGSTRPTVLHLVCMLFGVSMLVLSIAPGFLTATVALVFVGALSVAFIALGNTALQLASDPGFRGRVMALWTIAFLGTTPIGGPLIGLLSDSAGPRAGIALGGAAAIVAAWVGRRTSMPPEGHHHGSAPQVPASPGPSTLRPMRPGSDL